MSGIFPILPDCWISLLALGIGSGIGHSISCPPAPCLGPKKILHILVLPPDPHTAHFGWIRCCCLGCSRPWENSIPNPAGFIFFESRPKFGMLGTINTLILLERHGYITSLWNNAISFQFYHPDDSKNLISMSFRVCQSRLKLLLSLILWQYFHSQCISGLYDFQGTLIASVYI